MSINTGQRSRRLAGGTRIVCGALALFLVLGPVPSLATSETARQPELSQSERIDRAREKVGPIVRGLSTDITLPTILEIIEDNLGQVREIAREIETAVNVDDIIDDISERFDHIAENFQQIAEIAPDVMARREALLKDLDTIEREANFSAAGARTEIARLNAENSRLNKSIREDGLDATDLQKSRTDVRANEAIVRSLEAGVEVWGAFIEEHAEIIDKSEQNSKRLDSFLHTLTRNADVYRSFAEILRLRKSLAAISQDLRVIEQIDDNIQELEQSWDEFDKAIEKLRERFLDSPSS